MNSNDNGNFAGASLFGGAILAVVLGAIFLRHLQSMFEQLQKTFAAFSVMAYSAFGMLWWSGLVILTVAGIVAGVFCAIYFAVKYINLVKRATELQQAFVTKTAELDESVTRSREQIIGEVRSSIAWMNERLEDALKEPEVAPEVAAASEPAPISEGEPAVEITAEELPEPNEHDETHENEQPQPMFQL